MSVATEQVHTLEDLKIWPPAGARFPADGTALAVVGHPIAHSLSPAMHNAALRELARTDPKFSDWRYYRFDIPPGQLETAIGLFAEKKFHGLNLTVPHKTLVMGLPGFTVAPSHQSVRELGAANTLLREGAGWSGSNTDGFGLKSALAHDLGLHLGNRHFILLGAGGAARAAAVVCAETGASLWIGNRTQSNRDALIEKLTTAPSHRARKSRLRLGGFAPENPVIELPEGAIVINATSLGLNPDDESPLDLRKIPRPAAVFDMIYRPAETPLLRQAKAMGIPACNGLSMLVYQGAASLERWIGSKLPPDVLKIMHLTVRNALK